MFQLISKNKRENPKPEDRIMFTVTNCEQVFYSKKNGQGLVRS